MGNSKIVVYIAVGVIAAVVIAGVSLLASSLKKLESYEVGVKYDKVGKKLGEDIDLSGLHSGPPGFEFVKFPSVFKTIQFSSLECLTYDGAEVTLDVQYQYKAIEEEIPRIIRLFRDHERYVELLKLVGISVLQKSCSSITAKDIIDKRVEFASTTNTMLVEKNEEVMAIINGLQINNIERPSSYNEAQKNKESVRENIQVKTKQRPEKITEAEILVETALKDAEIKIQRANLDAKTTITRAEKEAEAIRKEAEVEAMLYLQISQAGFTGEGLINYIGVDTLRSSQKPVQVAMRAPANLP